MSEELVSRVSVRLLDREYQVACPAEERSDLLDSAEYLDSKTREIRAVPTILTGSVCGGRSSCLCASWQVQSEARSKGQKT